MSSCWLRGNVRSAMLTGRDRAERLQRTSILTRNIEVSEMLPHNRGVPHASYIRLAMNRWSKSTMSLHTVQSGVISCLQKGFTAPYCEMQCRRILNRQHFDIKYLNHLQGRTSIQVSHQQQTYYRLLTDIFVYPEEGGDTSSSMCADIHGITRRHIPKGLLPTM